MAAGKPTNPLDRDAIPTFPWRGGNRFRLLINGPAFYPVMLEAIAKARRCVLLEMYLTESGRVMDRFVQAFAGAAARGVKVLLLLDHFGSLGLNGVDRGRLADAGVHLVFFNPIIPRRLLANIRRDHRKLLLVDAERAFVGGAGISDSFDGPDGWRETMLEIRGPVVDDWREMFWRNWRHWSSPDVAYCQTCVSPPLRPAITGQTGRFVCSRWPRHTRLLRTLITRINKARRRVWLATAYFLPSIRLRRALRHAATRGVDVRLILPGPVTDHPPVRHAGRRYYERLLRHGVRIHEYQGRFMHAKVALVDDWSSIGSSNMDRWSLRWNLEANQEIADARFAGKVAEMLRTDQDHSREIDYRRWRERPWSYRLREHLWGRLDRWLSRWYPPPGQPWEK